MSPLLVGFACSQPPLHLLPERCLPTKVSSSPFECNFFCLAAKFKQSYGGASAPLSLCLFSRPVDATCCPLVFLPLRSWREERAQDLLCVPSTYLGGLNLVTPQKALEWLSRWLFHSAKYVKQRDTGRRDACFSRSTGTEKSGKVTDCKKFGELQLLRKQQCVRPSYYDVSDEAIERGGLESPLKSLLIQPVIFTNCTSIHGDINHSNTNPGSPIELCFDLGHFGLFVPASTQLESGRKGGESLNSSCQRLLIWAVLNKTVSLQSMKPPLAVPPPCKHLAGVLWNRSHRICMSNAIFHR